MHSDGYPEGLGCQIAESLINYGKLNNWELEHVDHRHGDLEYIYYVWQDHSKHAWISIFTVGFNANLDPSYDDRDKCIFVGKPDHLLNRFDERHAAPTCERCECECDYGKELCGTGCIKNTN